MKSVSFVIPFYNESESIEETVSVVLSILKKMTDDFELILVNDGSVDDSLPKVLKAFSQENSLLVISHGINKGLGAAIRTGFDAAQKDIVVYSDMDMPFDFHLLPEILNTMPNDVDILRGIRSSDRENWIRKIYSFGFKTFIYALFGYSFADPNFALKIFNRKQLQSLNLNSDGSFIDAEILLEALKLGYKIETIDIEYKHRQHGTSHLANFKNIFRILKEALSYKFKSVKNKVEKNHAL